MRRSSFAWAAVFLMTFAGSALSQTKVVGPITFAPTFLVSGGAIDLAAAAITNAMLAHPATTVNGQTCTLGSTCTVTAAASGVTIGTTTIGGGTTAQLFYDNAGVLGEVAKVNNAVLGTNGSGVPSFSTTLPNGLSATNLALTTPSLGTPSSGTLTNATGLPISGLSGLGSGVAAALGNTAGGSGGFALESALASFLPLAGGALTGAVTTSSTINKVTISAPITGATLSIADSKTLTDTSVIGNRLLLGDAGGGFAAYAGTSGPTHQWLTALSALGAGTYAQPTTSDLSDISTFNLNTSGTITTTGGGSITALATLGLRDTSAAFDVTLRPTSSIALTAGHTVTLDVVNGARTLKLGANLTIASDPGAVTGALKSDGAGGFTQAACADLSGGCPGGAATSITPGTTTVTSGTTNGLLYDNAGSLGNLASANNGVLVTSGSGVPSISAALPSGLSATNLTLTTPTLGVASATTINKLTLTAPASGATLTIADGKTLTDTSAIGAALLKGATGGGFAAATAADIPAPSTTAGSGGALVFVAPAGYVFCTTTCTVTPPVPAVGYQFCVFNDPGVSTVITVGGNTSVFYEKSDGTAYGTSGGHLTSGGANLDEMCIIGRDTTHYTIGAQHGTWTAS